MLLFGKYILIVIVAVLMLCVLSYISVPVYDFQSGRSFCGDSVYNPYAGADSSCWRKANFHAHQKEKPQCDYTVEQMLEAYRSNGYDIMSISDHQCLNTEHADRPGFIPTYEHGYGINGYHQLVMGAERVTWRDFPLMLTQSQMQYMLHWLRPQAEALVLNHPGKTRIIDLAVYGWLRGYDLLEINPERGRERSEQYWDTALSAGIYSTLIGDDDAHNIRNRSSWFQRCFTMVNTPSLRPGDIMKSLKKGAAYAVYVPHDVNNRPDPHGDLAPDGAHFDAGRYDSHPGRPARFGDPVYRTKRNAACRGKRGRGRLCFSEERCLRACRSAFRRRNDPVFQSFRADCRR